ncbi:MAG TPA: WG repeat-containing protein [Longimicrobium sp.]
MGYVVPSGKIVIQPQFDWAGDFKEGFAPVLVADRWA